MLLNIHDIFLKFESILEKRKYHELFTFLLLLSRHQTQYCKNNVYIMEKNSKTCIGIVFNPIDNEGLGELRKKNKTKKQGWPLPSIFLLFETN